MLSNLYIFLLYNNKLLTYFSLPRYKYFQNILFLVMQCLNKLTTCYICPDDGLSHRVTQFLDFVNHPVFRIQNLDIFNKHMLPSSDSVRMFKKLSDSKLVVCVFLVVRNHVLQPHRTTDKIIVVNVSLVT